MTTFDIIAIGRLSGQLRVPVSQLEKIVSRLEIKPAGRINGIVHYDVADTERIASVIREKNNPTPSH